MEEVFLPLHLLVLAYVVWNVFGADHMAFLWIRGTVATLDEARVRKYHKRVWIGLIGMILTGFALFWPLRDYLLRRPQFFIKMAFVITLICNSFVIGELQKTATTKTFASLSLKEKLPLFISGAVSTMSWIGAAITAFFLIPD